MPLVQKAPLPAHAHLWHHMQPGDFIDGYACDSDMEVHQAAQVAMSLPGWVDALLNLRNRLVAPLGLRTEMADPGGAMFPVTYDSDSELNLGFDDTHLNFRIGLMQDQGRIYMATWVHRNNLLGRAYLAAVMPFHVLITRRAVAQVARASAAVRA